MYNENELSLTEATVLALQGKLKLEETKSVKNTRGIKNESKNLEDIQMEIYEMIQTARNVDKQDKNTNIKETIYAIESEYPEIDKRELTRYVRLKADEIYSGNYDESKEVKNESVEIETDNVEVELEDNGNTTIETEDKTITVSNKVTENPPMEEPIEDKETIDVPVEGDETILPEEEVSEETFENDGVEDLEESKKIEGKKPKTESYIDKYIKELDNLQNDLRNINVSELSDEDYEEFKEKSNKMNELIKKIYDFKGLEEGKCEENKECVKEDYEISQEDELDDVADAIRAKYLDDAIDLALNINDLLYKLDSKLYFKQFNNSDDAIDMILSNLEDEDGKIFIKKLFSNFRNNLEVQKIFKDIDNIKNVFRNKKVYEDKCEENKECLTEESVKYEWVLQGNYGYGWDDLVTYDNKEEAERDYKDYKENEPEYAHRIRKRVVKEESKIIKTEAPSADPYPSVDEEQEIVVNKLLNSSFFIPGIDDFISEKIKNGIQTGHLSVDNSLFIPFDESDIDFQIYTAIRNKAKRLNLVDKLDDLYKKYAELVDKRNAGFDSLTINILITPYAYKKICDKLSDNNYYITIKKEDWMTPYRGFGFEISVVNRVKNKKESKSVKTETKQTFNKQSFEEVLTKFYKFNNENVKSFKVESIMTNKNGSLKIEGKLNDNVPATMIFDKKVEGKSFITYSLRKSNVLKESKEIKTTMMINKNSNILNCRNIISK